MKTKIKFTQAQILVKQLLVELKPYCSRLEPAGSYRRGKAEIGDIELCAIPLPTFDLFNAACYEPHQLDMVDWSRFGKLEMGGHKYKKIQLHTGIQLDLFIITPPAQWGIQFLIRTGSAEFSHKFVTPKSQGGMLPSYLKVKDGAIWSNNHILVTPEEMDVFDLCGVKYIPPELRDL